MCLAKWYSCSRAERLGQELEDGDKGEIEDGLDGHRVEHVDDLAEDPAGEDEGRAEHALHRRTGRREGRRPPPAAILISRSRIGVKTLPSHLRRPPTGGE